MFAREPPSDAELDECPFCEGREDRTPPEVLRLGDPWRIRVVPNLYPAVDRHEVVVHSPRHVRSVAELAEDELTLVAEAWLARREAVPDRYMHAFVNEGRDAGGSLAHSHSQLVWLDQVPPAVAGERPFDPPVELEIDRSASVVAYAAPAPRQSYELLIGPVTSDDLGAGLALAARLLRRLHEIAGPVPMNLWLHAGETWHLELVPRLSVLAGLELGAGVYVSSVAPEDAASQLRVTASATSSGST